MADPVRLSPLSHRADLGDYRDGPVRLREIADWAMFDLRIREDDRRTRNAVSRALGLTLPEKPRTSTSKEDRSALWLSIDQWLITAPIGERAGLMATLQEAIGDGFALLADLSDARAIIRIEGENARETVMKGAAVDMTGADIKAGTVRRMLFAEIAAMVHMVAARPDMIDLYVFRSYADYTWEWLVRTSHPNAAVSLWRPQAAPRA